MRIIVDSAIDMTEEEIKRYNLSVVNLELAKKEEGTTFVVSHEEAEEMILRFPGTFTTSCPSSFAFFKEMEKIVNEEEDSFFCFTISSGISGTFDSAKTAEEDLRNEAKRDFLSEVIDTGTASAGSAVFVIEAAKMIEEGFSFQEISDEIQRMINNSKTILTVDDLSYLQKSGRIKKIKAAVSKILSLKPILEFKDGKISNIGTSMGSPNGRIIKLIKEFKESRFPDENAIISIGISNNEKLTGRFLSDLERNFNLEKEILSMRKAGLIIIVHTGPGAYGIGIAPQHRKKKES